MAGFRYQVVAVGMWRGKIKRWNTTFHMPTQNSVTQIHGIMQKTGWPNPLDVVGACSGGISSISIYNSAGGPPVSVTTYFDWEVPSTWIPYTGEGWAGTPAGTVLDASGESALLVVGHLPGLSSTGKPITTRKYLHAIPSRTAADFSDPDVDAASQAAIEAIWLTGFMGNKAGVIPTSVTVEPYYGNHQRVRGRRRPVKVVAAGAFSLGVLAGGGATTSGQGDQFPGGEF